MKKALIVINVNKDESMLLAKEIKNFLENKGIDSEFLNFDGFCKNVPFCAVDFVVTLGGDGTVLFAARNSVEDEIPVFPVNLGQFGFIASVQPCEWKCELEKFLDGNAFIDERSMLDVKVFRNSELVYSSLGLNDVVISAKRGASTISLSVKYNNVPLCKLKSDGVIVATSTGSTAYSAAAGGPIVDPNLSAFVLTPVNSFSLSSRPIVLSPKGELSISVEESRAKEICITVDGQEAVSLQSKDLICVRKYGKKVKLISATSEKFYNALRSKLNWSGGPHA